ncbi:hypothetical protein BJ944DRAFT_261966 [Cunninghamella echinulata]|nr:hypothetical protein BJ944DRAFT_261966 [Cunninghamella echinulata]
MFKKLQNKTSHASFEMVTPNSRMISPSSKNQYHAVASPSQPPPPPQIYHNYQQPSSNHKVASTHYDPNMIFDTYGNNGHESMIDPIRDVNQGTGVSRQTFIEPNKSTMVHSPVTPLSVYGKQQFLDTNGYSNNTASSIGNINFFQSTSDLESVADSENIHYGRPSTIIQPRMQHVEMPVKIQQVHQPAQASYATIENAYPHHQHHQRAAVTNYDPQPNASFNLQPAPSKSTSAISSSNNHYKSSRHPQPLPPLVIPPTPSKSTSSPNRSLGTSQHISPLPSSSQLTPSLTPASSGLSPMTISPSTPTNQSRQHNPAKSPLSPLPSKTNSAENSNSTDPPISEAESLLLEGIKYHESGKLEQATYYFRKAAQLKSPMAMFFYGVSLRHGWGCQKNEQIAFQYIQKAAEHAVVDLNSISSSKVNTSAVKGELVMAIYEMGVSFRHGWGCRKNKETAFYFFKIAADLGDADAQNDLGHCYYNGHGVKKDIHMAAKYYRKADKQGHGIMGNSWIWKKKYDPK